MAKETAEIREVFSIDEWDGDTLFETTLCEDDAQAAHHIKARINELIESNVIDLETLMNDASRQHVRALQRSWNRHCSFIVNAWNELAKNAECPIEFKVSVVDLLVGDVVRNSPCPVTSESLAALQARRAAKQERPATKNAAKKANRRESAATAIVNPSEQKWEDE